MDGQFLGCRKLVRLLQGFWSCLRQPLRQSWQRLEQVVVDNDHEEQQYEYKGRLIDALLNADADVAPHDRLNDEFQKSATVQDGDGQKVEDAEVEADHCHQAKQGCPSRLTRGVTGSTRNTDRSFHLLDGDLVLEHLLHQVHDQERVFLVLFQGTSECLREGQLVHTDGLGAEAEPIGFLPVILGQYG